jgi:predicted ATPase
LLGLAEQRPLLLVIEDLHWSDDTSLEFLLGLARHLRSPAAAAAHLSR